MTVEIIKQKGRGRFEQQSANGVVWWLDEQAAAPAVSIADLYLSFALTMLGTEEHLFPSFLLDDWGNEIKSLKLYRWIREYGEQFPRAELFAYGLDGESRQHFLRELELYAPYPCYAFATADTPLVEAKLVSHILLPDASRETPQPVAVPEHIQHPLRSAAVRWWAVPSGLEQWDFLKRNEVA